MVHPLVSQLRFTRREFARALTGVSDDDGRIRIFPMNCIAWNVGHLSWQEQRCFLIYAQGRTVRQDVDTAYAYGAPASTPVLSEVRQTWVGITREADSWLEGLTSDALQEHVVRGGKPSPYLYGSLLQRVIYHYWYHTGENMAIRQMLGHASLPEFVGDIDSEAPYRAE